MTNPFDPNFNGDDEQDKFDYAHARYREEQSAWDKARLKKHYKDSLVVNAILQTPIFVWAAASLVTGWNNILDEKIFYALASPISFAIATMVSRNWDKRIFKWLNDKVPLNDSKANASIRKGQIHGLFAAATTAFFLTNIGLLIVNSDSSNANKKTSAIETTLENDSRLVSIKPQQKLAL